MSDHRWKNQQYNFDNLGRALLTLFVLALKDGWIPRMYNDIDAVSVEMQPIKNYNEATLIYFISFILIVRFFLLNMFAGIIIKSFHDCHAQQELEEEARNKVKRAKKIERQQRLIRELPYYTRFPLWRKCLHDVYVSKYFDLIITAIIILNVVTMSLEYYSMPSDLYKFLEYCNYAFTVVFLLEFIWKIVTLGPSRYFKDKWNQLDLFIVLLSIAGIVIDKMLSRHILPINAILILFKLLKIATGVRALLDTVVHSLPQIGNLDTLRQDDPSCADKNHFITIISPIYFIVFILVAQFVLINIVVAVLMKKLADSNKMIADDAEMDEEIERQLESDVLVHLFWN
ncbi:unnamed protein product [Rotaria sordida]|uniref:Ion transport domain-containing protein n=1 Tax=Rotaria sordida TaxID=392033 RepID=A0A819NAY7_9BILA|nr:unnamed protein product [Rotaria sordida]